MCVGGRAARSPFGRFLLAWRVSKKSEHGATGPRKAFFFVAEGFRRLKIRSSLCKYRVVSFTLRLLFPGANQWSFPLPSSEEESTIFILGTGSSVDDFRQDKFLEINSASSVGVNFWALHPFKPTIYALEKTNRRGFASPLEVLAEDERKSTTPIMFFGRTNWEAFWSLRRLRNKNPNILFYPAIKIWPQNPNALAKTLDAAFRALKSANDESRSSLDAKASIVRIISIAAMNGWKKIVLVGIDLEGRYFSPAYGPSDDPLVVGNRKIALNSRAGDTHRTDDPSVRGALRMSTFLPILAKSIYKNFGATLFSASGNLALKTGLPEYEWPGFRDAGSSDGALNANGA